MKVIFLADVKGTGKKGQVLEVSDGHAKNFLIPRKLAAEANKENINTLETNNRKLAQKAKEEREAAEQLAAGVEAAHVSIAMKVGESGRMFGSVAAKEIADSMAAQHDIQLDKKKIVLPEPLKTVGTHVVSVKLHPEVTGKVTVIIVPEAE